MKPTRLIEKAKENRWLILAILFFIVWKFFLIHTLWHDRALPPEPDDSYNYITQIVSIAQCSDEYCPTAISLQNSSGFVYLFYRLPFGLLAKITHLSSEAIYHLSFYIGTILLAFFLPFFLRTFSTNKKVVAWSVFFLSFYHGFGETHGFYWVVPSFFLILLFLLLLTFIIQEKKEVNYWLLGGITLVYTFSHPISIFLISVLPLYLIFLNFFTQRISIISWKRTSFVISILLFASFVSHHSLINKAPNEDSYSFQAVIDKAQSSLNNPSSHEVAQIKKESRFTFITTSSVFSKHYIFFEKKINTLSRVYFHWLFPSWIFIIPFLMVFFILIYKQQLELIALYLASFFFFIITTTLDPLGYRTGILLWLITYILFAFSSWYGFEIIQEKTKGVFKKIFLGIYLLLISIFLSLNAILAFLFNENINVRNDYPIPPELIQHIEALPSEEKITFSKEFVVAEMWNISSVRERSVHINTKPNYVITTNYSYLKEKPHSVFSSRIWHIAAKLGYSQSYSNIQAPSLPPLNYHLDKDFGVFSLYKRAH